MSYLDTVTNRLNGQAEDPLDMFSSAGDSSYYPTSSGGVESGSIFDQPNTLGAPDTVAGGYNQGFIDDLFGNLDREMGMIPGGAQLDLNGVPQPTAQTMMGGYDPQTLAQMRSQAIDDTSGAGITQMSQMRRALGQAGYGQDSPASAAIFGDVARQTGMAQNSALRGIDIANAEQQMTNQTNSMAAVNAMALANANRMFDAMNTNIANQQAMQGAKANMVGQFGSQLGAAQLGKQAGADTANAAAGNRNKELQFGAGEDRWKTGVGALSNIAGEGIGNFQNGTSTAGNLLGSIGQVIPDIFSGSGNASPNQADSPLDSNIFRTEAYA